MAETLGEQRAGPLTPKPCQRETVSRNQRGPAPRNELLLAFLAIVQAGAGTWRNAGSLSLLNSACWMLAPTGRERCDISF